MLKVIIVDDEIAQREGLLKHISWQDFDMEVVFCAANGFEALEAAKSHRPDVLITDVKMPRMNGLELSKAIKEQFPDCKIMIISGYEEFEIYKSAIELQAQTFLMKPIQLHKMKENLASISSIFITEQSKRRELRLLKEQLNASKPLLVDNFVRDLLGGFVKDENAVAERAAFLSLSLPKAGFYVLSVQPDDRPGQETEESKQFFHFTLYTLLAAMCTRFGGFLTSYKDGEHALIIEADESRELLTERIDAEKALIRDTVSRSITVGVSNRKQVMMQASEGYREAETAARQRFYLGKGKTILFDDLNPQGTISHDLEQNYQAMMSFVAIGDLLQSEEYLNTLVGAIAQQPYSLQEQTMKVLCFRVISDSQRILYDAAEKTQGTSGTDEVMPANSWDAVNNLASIPEMQRWMKEKLSDVVLYIYGSYMSKHSTVIDAVRKTLETEYFEQITIQELAQKVYLTPNYLCNLFKEQVGESIIEHLTKIRMKHAKRLLAGTSLHIYEVAEQTGFKSLSYFGIVFKNMFGTSPKEYRKSLFHRHGDNRTRTGATNGYDFEAEF